MNYFNFKNYFNNFVLLSLLFDYVGAEDVETRTVS